MGVPRADRDPLHGTWTGVQIDPGPLFGVHSQAPADFDGTGRVQVMVGETNVGGWDFGPNPDPQIYVYRLLGPASSASAWERSLVDHTGTHEGRARDMDGDGRPDLVGDEETCALVGAPEPASALVRRLGIEAEALVRGRLAAMVG